MNASKGASTLDPIAIAAKAGLLDKQQAAFFWCLRYYELRHKLPDGKLVAPGVRREYKMRISTQAGFRGLAKLRKTDLSIFDRPTE